MTDRLERLINLVIALRETRRPLTAADVNERVAGYQDSHGEAFRRMFERDKADLRDLGVPIETVVTDRLEEQAGYRIDPRRYDLPEVRLAPDEVAALAVAAAATGLSEEAGVGLLKLQVAAGAPEPQRLAPSPPVAVPLELPHRDTLVAAQLIRTPVRFTYRAASGETSVRTVDPHALLHRRGRWYLVGRDHDRDARRAFRLDRVEGRVRPAGEAGAFELPREMPDTDDVVPPRPLAGEVAEVHAAPSVAWQVARRARGAGTPLAGGWTRYDVAIGDADDFAYWLLQYGPEAVVHAPDWLREDVVRRLRAVAG